MHCSYGISPSLPCDFAQTLAEAEIGRFRLDTLTVIAGKVLSQAQSLCLLRVYFKLVTQEVKRLQCAVSQVSKESLYSRSMNR